MKLSKLGLKTTKSIGKDEALAMEMLFQSGQLKRFSAGLYGYGTLLVRTKQKLENIIRKHLDNAGCAEVQFSILQNGDFWKASGRWQKYVDSGHMFTTMGRHGEYAICATAEEMSVEFLRNHIQSYKDLGFCQYQIGTKFRDELRVQGGIIRSKEFQMMDAYSFDESKEKMIESFERMKEVYYKIFNELGLDIKNIVSVNDMGGKIASEFMWFDEEYGQDTILCNDEKGLYISSEVYDLQDEKLRELVLGEHKNMDISQFEKRKALELGHIFQNDQIYSRMMSGAFTNREGKKDYYWNGCYGIGVSRIICILVANSFKKYGKLIWEDEVSAFTVNIISKKDDDARAAAEELYNDLRSENVDVCFDDRELNIGEKIKDNDLFGIRRIVIVGNEFLKNGRYSFEDRATDRKVEVSKSELLKILK